MLTSIHIYSAAAFAIGLFLGLIVELAIDNSYLRKLEKENDELRDKLSQAEKMEIIEIRDDRQYAVKTTATPVITEDYFKKF